MLSASHKPKPLALQFFLACLQLDDRLHPALRNVIGCRPRAVGGNELTGEARESARERHGRKLAGREQKENMHCCMAVDASCCQGSEPATTSCGMDENDVRKLLGEPDEIVSSKDRKRSRIWVCSDCGAVTHTEQPINSPSPCVIRRLV